MRAATLTDSWYESFCTVVAAVKHMLFVVLFVHMYDLM